MIKVGQMEALPQFWCNSWDRARRRSASRHIWKDASAEKLKTGASVHLAFDGLQPVDLAFHLASAPLSIDGRSNCSDVFLKAISEAYYRTELAAFGPVDPKLHLGGLIGRQCVAEAECEVS
jgi:hypothetical protein